MPKLSLSLPKKGKILVSVGQKVLPNFPLAEYKEEQIVLVDLAKSLGVKGPKVFHYLIRKIGEKVLPNDIIAIKKNLFTKKISRAPVGGTINFLEENKGLLGIDQSGKSLKLFSPVEGVVDEVIGDKTVVLEFKGEVIEAKDAVGNKWGNFYVVSENEGRVNLYDIKNEYSRGVLAGYFWPMGCVRKALALDCGIVGVVFEDKLEKISKFNYLEREAAPVMIIGRDSFNKLTKLSGHQAVLSGNQKKLFIAAYDTKDH